MQQIKEKGQILGGETMSLILKTDKLHFLKKKTLSAKKISVPRGKMYRNNYRVFIENNKKTNFLETNLLICQESLKR
jgi:hypothetical protein